MLKYQCARRSVVLALSLIPVLALTACGDGWEVKPYTGVPYTHDRTAGRGVEYVRANMFKPREANTETLMKKEETTIVAPAEQAPPPVTAGDAVFSKKQSK